jgi:phage terminase small subunit
MFVPEGGTAFAPEHLHEDAQACIEHILRCYGKFKEVKEIDTYALSTFATAWAWHKAAVHRMNARDFEPITKTSRGHGEVPNGWFKILWESSRVMTSLMGKLFLSPQDRYVPSAGKVESSGKFAGLLGNAAAIATRAERRESSASLNA